MPSKVRFAADISNVREITLVGRADGAYWTRRLAAEGLSPVLKSGQAEILVIAAEMRFQGILFREMSFSVAVTPPEHAEGASAESAQEAVFLVQAFNSVRFFAFVERTIFSTPYAFADVRVSRSGPARLEIVRGKESLFLAAMDSDAPGRSPGDEGPDRWSGQVYLPTQSRGGPRRRFYAILEGPTTSAPFLAEADELVVRDPRGEELFTSLRESNFTGHQWRLRPQARHAKGKTERWSAG